jgi:dihydroorotate dehydrogenase
VSAWRRAAYRAVRPLLFTADPERIHHAALSALVTASATTSGRALCSLASGVPPAHAARQPFEIMGLRFRNRIGLGAGFDKDGVAIRGWAALGLGFVELGTVTPQPQAGNSRPRLFRLAQDEALINRMGFNNLGADALARRVADVRSQLPDGFVIGVNVGRNRDTPEDAALGDYVAAARSVAAVAGYLAVNVSSPNTPGLRDLQRPDRLIPLLQAVADAAPSTPVVVKLSPDLGAEDRDRLVEVIAGSPARGLILANSTTSRRGLTSPLAAEAGGVSGRPLLPGMLASIARARELAGARLAIIASGGVGGRADATAARSAGADLVQLWTGMIYAGPGLIGETVRA